MKVPLRVFKSTDGLKVGVRIGGATAGGREFSGTVTAIGKDDVEIREDSPVR